MIICPINLLYTHCNVKRVTHLNNYYILVDIFAQELTPMETIMKQQPKHPSVIALGVRGNIAQTFVTVEGEAIAMARGVTSAVDRILKLYFLMNMEYAENVKHILHFLQRTVLCIEDDLTLSRGGSDLSLYLRNKLAKF